MPTQPALRAPWEGQAIITQGNNGSTHQRSERCNNYYAIDVQKFGRDSDDKPVAIDFDVVAPAEGVISNKIDNANAEGGKQIWLQVTGPEGDEFLVIFLHLSDVNVKGINDEVAQGEKIAVSGSTGTDSHHLHFHLCSVNSYSKICSTIPISKLLLKGPIDGTHDDEIKYYESDHNPDVHPDYGSLDDSVLAGQYGKKYESMPTDENCAEFIADVNIPDGFRIEHGKHFSKGWIFKNCSLWRDWGDDCEAVKKDGSFGPESFPVPNIGPEGLVTLWVDMTAPETIGTHRATYQLVGYHDGQKYEFGPRFWVEINVVERPLGDVVLVIDRTGSMQGNKMEAAKAAANLFVDLMRPRDKIGIVPFSCRVRPEELCQVEVEGPDAHVFRLREIGREGSGSATSIAAHTFINELDADAEGYTSIGAGLQAGLTLLESIDPPRVMLVISDGKENRDPRARGVVASVLRNYTTVFTVGLGSDADAGLLFDIAHTTGGIYRFAASGDELPSIFSEILGKIYGENVLRTASGTVSSGGTLEEKVLVDSTVGLTIFSLFWRGSELDLTLVQPDGSIIDPTSVETNPNISFTSGRTYQFYKINNPQAGEWTMRIYGKSTPAEGEAYSISVSAMSSMNASIKFDRAEYFAGDPIKIETRIEYSVGDSTEPGYVLGADIKVTVEDPYLNRHSFDLYDDGLHGDGEANDGLYANTFTNTSLIGNYNFRVQVSGTNNRDGQPFTREYAFSHVVQDPTLRFPNTPVLDDFNRKNGRIGRSWSGAKSRYRIVDQQVHVRKGGPIYWKPGILAADQQAFFTLVHVDPSGLEQGLLLKVQDKENHRGNWRKGAVAIFYNARESKVGIKSCVSGQEWQTLALFEAKLQDGDQLGGRAETDGKVRAFVNGTEIGSVEAGSFSAGKGGRIGMWFTDADDAVLDDFGGGGAISVPVMQGTDDAGPEPSGCGYRTDDGNIYFGHCMDGSPIASGFRFQNVLLPARAAIVEAHLDFTVDGPYANEMALQFLGERSANAATFSNTDRPSDRPTTAALVPWAIPAANVWNFNEKWRTPSVTAIVQELVNLPGWASGNAMAIIIQADPGVPGDTHRRVYAWEREQSAAARLKVIYTIESFARGDDEGDDDDNDDDDDDDHNDDR